jgi:hypothetical protein
MTFNVQNMISSLNKSGIAKSSHFEVYISGPEDFDGAERDMVFRADSAELPGRSLITIEHKFTNIGPFNKIPYGQIYSDVVLTFLSSEDMREKYYFELWQENIMNTGGFEQINGRFSRSGFSIKYFDSYLGTVNIRQYGQNGSLRSVHQLREAYPISIAPVTVNWNDETPIKLSITFAYKNYSCVFYRSDQPSAFNLGFGSGGITGSVRIPNLGFATPSGFGLDLGGINTRFAQIRRSF